MSLKASEHPGAVLTNRSLAALGLAVLVVVASIELYPLYYSNAGANSRSQTGQTSNSSSLEMSSQSSTQNSGSSQTSRSTSFVSQTFTRGNFSASTDSKDGLRLVLSMDATAMRLYDSLSVKVEEQNTLPHSVNATPADNWAIHIL